MIEIRRLLAFVAVAEERHVTRAAMRLGIQQPALTRIIQGLESELRTPLMVRLPRGIRLTDAGETLYAEARNVIALAERIPSVIERVARGEQGRLSIGFTTSAAVNPFVPNILRKFRTLAPGIDITLEEAGTVELVDSLLNERLDAAFMRAPIGIHPLLKLQLILEESMVVALPIGHPLANARKAPIKLSHLSDQAFVLYRRATGPGLYDAILSACQRAGFNPQVAQEAPRLSSILSLVAAGVGISLVPSSMQFGSQVPIVYRPLDSRPRLVAPLHLATRLNAPTPIGHLLSLLSAEIRKISRDNMRDVGR